MSRQGSKRTLVAFKIEADVAEVLNSLPNKSDFIRKAIVAQLGVSCPLCHGRGIVLPGVHNLVAPVVESMRSQTCAHCGRDLHLPTGSVELHPTDRARLEQFFLGGPLYCEACYGAASACDQCGWHIDTPYLGDHLRLAHPTRTDPEPGGLENGTSGNY